MKAILMAVAVFLLLGSASSSVAQPSMGNSDRTTPVLIEGYFVGGLENGKWLPREDFYKKHLVNMNNFKYDVYVNDEKIGTAKGGEPMDKYRDASADGERVELSYSDNVSVGSDSDNESAGCELALRANWDLFPRPYREQGTHQRHYQTLVRNILADEGVNDPVTTIKQLIRVDLDGDGTDEVLIAADSTLEGSPYDENDIGDNSILIFRKLVDGEVQDQVVSKDLVLNDARVTETRNGLLLFGIRDIADLDGDGVMEVVVHERYYEGESYVVYKLIENRLKMVAEGDSNTD